MAQAKKSYKKILTVVFAALALSVTALVATKTNAVFKGPDPATNGRLVWTRKDGNVYSIKTADTAGQNGKILFSDPAAAIIGDTVWSPDQSKIAFVMAKDNQTHIYTIDSDTENQTTPTAITEGSGESGGTDPSWSPDGSKLIYAKQVGSASNIFVISANGTGTPTQLTSGYTTAGSQAFDPHWSPILGSKQIVFTVSDTQITPSMNSNIHTALLNSGETALVSGSDEELEGASWNTSDGADKIRGEYDPQFNPEGDKVMFVRRTTGGSYTIGTVPADGSSTSFSTLVPNTITGGPVFDPAFSPNGRHVSFEPKSNLLSVGSIRIANVTDPDDVHSRLYSTNGAEADWTYATVDEQPPAELPPVSIECTTEVGKSCTIEIPAYCINDLETAPLHGTSTVVPSDAVVEGVLQPGTLTYTPAANPDGSYNEEEENYAHIRDDGTTTTVCNVKIIFTKKPGGGPFKPPATGIIGGLIGVGLAAAVAGGAIYAKEHKNKKAKAASSEK